VFPLKLAGFGAAAMERLEAAEGEREVGHALQEAVCCIHSDHSFGSRLGKLCRMASAELGFDLLECLRHTAVDNTL
jgi:hypothetical protein